MRAALLWYTSSTRTRRGGSCLKDIYKTLLIYRTCMRRAPAKPVRACILRKWCPVAHVTFEAPLRTSHFSLHSSHSTLHASHSTLHTSHCTLRTPHFTSHCTLKTPHFTLHASHFTVHTSHFSLLSQHSTLHTALFTPHTSHCTLHTPHFISSELFSPYPSSALLISSLLICHLSFHESLPSTTTKELACAVRQPGPCVRALCAAVAVLLSKNMTLYASPVQCNVKQALSSHITLHPLHFTSELFSSGFMSSHMSATFFLAIFMSSERSSNFLMRWTYFQLISALLHVSKVERNSFRFFYMPKGVDHKIFTLLRSLMPSVDALHQIATASVNMV